jgi:hypothetical protein
MSMSEVSPAGGLPPIPRHGGSGREHLDDFFDNAPVALHSVDCDGIIRRANEAELALLGYDAESYVSELDARQIRKIAGRLQWTPTEIETLIEIWSISHEQD